MASISPALTMSPPPPEHALGQPHFRKHKALPRPHNHRALDDDTRPNPASHDPCLAVEALSSAHPDAGHPLIPRVLKHESRTIGTRPSLPPTPPNHSRDSSGSYSVLPCSQDLAHSRLHAIPQDVNRPVVTPPDHRSPPTPDVTPPGPALRPHALRPSALDRSLSKPANMGSPIQSFETAREEPSSSDDESDRFTVGQMLASASKPHEAANSQRGPVVSPPDLQVALERIQSGQPDVYKSQLRRRLAKFDGTWCAPPDVEREWASNLGMAMARPKKHVGFEDIDTPQKGTCNGTLDHDAALPTDAAKPVSLHEAPLLSSPPQPLPNQGRGSSTASNSESSIRTDTKRLSGQSIKSNPSTIVEVILVNLPPQRQRTLRHVQKRGTLRDTTDRSSPVEGNAGLYLPKPIALEHRGEANRRINGHALGTSNSIASGRARREVWENGGIPVFVVPERRSSSKGRSTKEHALRSTSGRRSKRATSPDPVSYNRPARQGAYPKLEQEPRRGRRRPESDSHHLEHKTVDLTPSTPARSAPLSAHANGDALGPADHRRALDSPQEHVEAHTREGETTASPDTQSSPFPEVSFRFEPDEGHDLASLGRHEDALSSKKFSSRNTPFSIASFETSGTAPEVSEAMAVQMFHHQNSSVLVVNHLAKPAEVFKTANGEAKDLAQPIIKTTSPGGGSVTPRRWSSDEVESPLRNPRPPPTPPAQPPAINFIPATPSGSTPAQERIVRQGNYFEETGETPPRRPSMVRRVLGRRRHSVDCPPTASRAPSLLTRTLSLSRNVRRPQPADSKAVDAAPPYPRKDAVPADENRLHPFWRAQAHEEERPNGDGHDNYDYDAGGARPKGSSGEGTWAVPARVPKRGFSARMKRTFAIFPIRDDESFPTETANGPERRTIRRTSSGNLRVMPRRASADSYLRRESMRGAAYAAPDANERRGFWGGRGLRQRGGQEVMRRSAMGRPWEGIQKLPRMLSERRREKRSKRLRQMISGPKDVRDGVREVIEPRGPQALRQTDGYGLI